MPILEPHEIAFVFNSQTGMTKVFVGNGDNGEAQLGLISRCAFTAGTGDHPQGAVEIHLLEDTSPATLGRCSRDVQNSLARSIRYLMDHRRVQFTSPIGRSNQLPPADPVPSPQELSRFDREEPL